jgi:hypothetical protein
LHGLSAGPVNNVNNSRSHVRALPAPRDSQWEGSQDKIQELGALRARKPLRESELDLASSVEIRMLLADSPLPRKQEAKPRGSKAEMVMEGSGGTSNLGS